MVTSISKHAQERMSQRHITQKHINFAVRCGTRIDSDNEAALYCVGREHLNRGAQRLPKGLDGVVVVVAKGSDTKVITVYRDHHWRRHYKDRRAA